MTLSGSTLRRSTLHRITLSGSTLRRRLDEP
ncbi:MAG: hypothetical protein ACK52I_10800 [Pseudomonadota bacterium]